MYRYDAIDKDMLADRVGRVPRAGARRLAGEITEDQFKPLRLMNGLYLQLHAYMLRIAIPYGTLNARQLRKLAHDRPHLRQGLRPLHHPHQPAAALDQAARRAGHPRRAGRGRPARDPDLRQLHPQHHRRPPRRRRRPTRSTIRASGPRRSASGRPSTRSSRFLPRKFKIAVTAAAEGPRGDQDLRHRPAPASRRRDGDAGLRGAGRRRPRPHALSRPDHPRAPAGAPPALATCRRSCASTTATAGATTLDKARIKILVASLGRRGVRPPGRGRVGEDRQGRPSTCPTPSWPASAPPSRRVGFETLPARLGGVRGGQGGRSGLRPLRAQQRHAAQERRATPSSTSR